MARIVHVIQILTLGGGARALMATARSSARSGSHAHAVISLLPSEAKAAALARESGLRLIDAPDRAALQEELAAADIVQLHYWNVPEVLDFMRGPLPPMRLMAFYHIAGDTLPHIITPGHLDFADMNVPCNPYTYHDNPTFRDMDPGRKRVDAGLVYGAADLSRLDGLKPRPHQGFRVGYIGTIDFIKMHPDYVRMSAAIRIPDVRFVVCGDGSLDVLRRQAAELGVSDRFEIRGYVDDVRSAIEEFDVYGYPLCEETYAGSELNLQEVMYAGLAPVVFPYGGVKRLVVNDYTGYIVHSAAEYRDAVEHLWRHPEERARLGGNAREYARQIFGSDNAAAKINALYARLLERPKRTRAWPGAADGSSLFLGTLGEAGSHFRASRDSSDLRSLLAADAAVAASTRLAFISGILAYRGRHPADPYLRYWAGLGFDNLGNPGEAAMEYVEAIKAGFPHWRVQWRLVEAARALGRPDLVQTIQAQLDAKHPGYLREIEAARRPAQDVPAAPAPAAPAASAAPAVPAAPPAASAAAHARSGDGPDWTPEQAAPREEPEILRAEAALGAGRPEEAMRILEAHVAARPGHARALNDLGVALHVLGRKDEARRRFLEAVKADPTLADAVANLSDSMGELGLHQEAMGLCYRFLDDRPEDATVLAAAAAAEEGWADGMLARSLVRDLNYRKRDYRVSALVSTYKSAAFMRECLEDLEGQSIAEDLEIVIVDASSPEDEGSIVEEFQRRYSNIRYIRTPERIGIYPAWNLAVRASSGTYLTPFSTNDRLNPKAYELMRDVLERRPEAALVYGDSDLTHLPHQRFGAHATSPEFGRGFRWPEYRFEDLVMNCRVGPHPMWRRTVHGEIGYFDGRYKAIGDQDFWIRLGIRHELLHIPAVTGLAWITPDSLSGESSSQQEIFEIHHKHTRAYLERLKAKGPPPAAQPPTPTGGPGAAAPTAEVTAGRDRKPVTAVVSTYASERFLRGCLQNLVEQTLFRAGGMEIVVVDSGSPENERAIAEEFVAAQGGITYVRTQRESLYAAWNRAVRCSTSRYLVNANTDDRHRRDAFAIMAGELDRRDVGLVYADALLTERENETYASNTAGRVWALPAFNLRQALVDCPFGCVVMWRRELHARFGEFDPAFRIAGDYEFFLKASREAGAWHVREPLALYYESMKNLSYGDHGALDREVDTFLPRLRREIDLGAVYPFLRSDPSPAARAAAHVDLATLFLHPLGRTGAAEAEFHLRLALEAEGRAPAILANLFQALFMQRKADAARDILAELQRLDPAAASRISAEYQAVPPRRALFQLPHPGLSAMPAAAFMPESRIPLSGYRAAVPAGEVFQHG